MKKIVLITLAAVGIFGVIAISGALLLAKSATSNYQGDFIQAVQSGDSAEVIAMIDEELLNGIDEPVLLAWMQAVNENLGQYEGVSGSNFSTSVSYEADGKKVETTATLNFEKGVAESEIVFRDGKIVGFTVESDKLDGDWFKGPASTTLYEDRAKSFFENFADGDMQAAYEEMDPLLREHVSVEILSDMRKATNEMVGELTKVDITTNKFSTEPSQHLVVNALIEGESGVLDGVVVFQFDGLQGKMTKFTMAEQK